MFLLYRWGMDKAWLAPSLGSSEARGWGRGASLKGTGHDIADRAVVMLTFRTGTQEAVAGGSLSSRTDWSTEFQEARTT